MDSTRTIVITGGLGYIGLPTALALSRKRYRVVVFDRKVPKKRYPFLFHHGDIRYLDALTNVVKEYRPSVVLHLAAVTSVAASEKEKKRYVDTNVMGTKNVLHAMHESGCTKFIFASSAAVYGASRHPVREDAPCHPSSFYGQTKKEAEVLIRKERTIHAVILRYFNVVGDESIVKNPKLIPSAMRVAKGLQKKLILYGHDYPTSDGTAVRDYVYLGDVVRANCMAVRYIEKNNDSIICNIASGIGVSNLNVVREVECRFHACIPVAYGKKRKETVVSVADITRAKTALHWNPKISMLTSIVKMFR